MKTHNLFICYGSSTNYIKGQVIDWQVNDVVDWDNWQDNMFPGAEYCECERCLDCDGYEIDGKTIYVNYDLCRDGGLFRAYVPADMTKEQIERFEAKIRNNRDVVRLSIIKLPLKKGAKQC